MTTEDSDKSDISGANIEKLNENLRKVEALSSRLGRVMSNRSTHQSSLDGPDQALFKQAATAYWAEALQNPAKVIEHQLEFWSKSVTHFVEAQQAISSGKLQAPADIGPEDRRFSNPMWDNNPYFNFIKQQYQINSAALQQAVDDVTDMEPLEKQRLSYFSNQIIDMMSPTNFLATNPDALEKAVATDGQSLIDGLENLISDLEANNGELVVKLADDTAFEIGGNIATTPGKVVFRNKMMELVQYNPTTEKVHETPLIIFPPWINKFYILDLKEKNSMVKWLTDQGYTLFMVSWINPDKSYSYVGMDDYIEDAYLAAF
jgi:polyhydroxyalkanoate synthase